ncbi:MAG: hypothetical protein IJV16_11005 [Lachnospiraceae bacterium]|nr:hypothetical protein [Lachnospiraceae bacterium]MBR1524384.1 hypothetical protein [Lachnospiraceae bacterium]
MGLIYTSLPLSSPTRQRYQNIIDNSRALIAKRWGTDGNQQNINNVSSDWAKILNNMYSSGIGWNSEKSEEPLSAIVRNGKVVGSSDSSGSSQKEETETSEIDNRREQQTNLMDLYNMMRGNFFGGGFGNNYFGWF